MITVCSYHYFRSNEHSRKELRDKCKEKIRTKKAQGNKSQKRLAKKAKK